MDLFYSWHLQRLSWILFRDLKSFELLGLELLEDLGLKFQIINEPNQLEQSIQYERTNQLEHFLNQLIIAFSFESFEMRNDHYTTYALTILSKIINHTEWIFCKATPKYSRSKNKLHPLLKLPTTLVGATQKTEPPIFREEHQLIIQVW